MQIFLDSTDTKVIADLASTGLVDGVTTLVTMERALAEGDDVTYRQILSQVRGSERRARKNNAPPQNAPNRPKTHDHD